MRAQTHQRKSLRRRMALCLAESLENRCLLSKTICVDVNSPGPTRDGTTWTNAYADLQLALSAAVSGDTIHVADGTCKPTSTTDRYKSFQLKTGVALYGGYAGYNASNPDARDIAAYPTILSGDIGTAGSIADNSYHVVAASGTASSAVLDGFTITAGNASDYGGGIYNIGGNATINSCTISGNSAPSGAGMYSSGGSPVIGNCLFGYNTVLSNGGAAYCTGSSAQFTACTFTGNTANGSGGGMYIANYGLTLVGCVFTGNVAGSGGGVFNSASTLTLTNCLLAGNFASALGGGVYSTGAVSATNCTLSGNTASSSGGGIYRTGGSITLANCILWGNVATSNGQFYASVTPSVTYCDVEGGYTGTGNKSADPALVRTPSAGSDGRSGTADDDYGDLRPRYNSPCIDAGSNFAVPVTVTTDITGAGRFADIPSVANTGLGSSPFVDMGAYENRVGVMASISPAGTVGSGSVITFHGQGTSSQAGVLTYAWEWTGDGKFDDGAGSDPVFNALGRTAPSTVTVSLRVTDTASQTAIASTTVQIVPVIYVDDSATGSNNGTTWANAFTSLSAALSAATAGKVIRVGAGTYKPTTTTDRNISFQLKNGVSIVGGYAGYGAANPDLRDVSAFPAVLSGNIGNTSSSSDNSYHVVVGSSTDSTAVLDGFTITAGNANNYGGGLYINAGGPTVTACTFTGNSAPSGGGMYAYASWPTLTNCTFVRNSATTRGGALYLQANRSGFPITLRACTFNGNTAGEGGGVSTEAAASFANCVFSGNAATGNSTAAAGGMTSNANLTLTNCTFSGNTGVSGAYYGVSGVADNCIFWGNVSTSIYAPPPGGTISYSDIPAGWPHVNHSVSVDPCFVRNPSTGVDGLWGTADDDYGDLRLASYSPVADAGSNTALPSGLVTDAGGASRVQDIPTTTDTGLGTAPIVDIGAYEATPLLAASAGGPYVVVQGHPVALAGRGASSVGPLQYAWEWDGDGLFDEATGDKPVFQPDGWAPYSLLTVKVRVTDGASQSVISQTTLRVVPDVLYVDSRSVGTGDGTTWANAINDLASALRQAVPGQIIRAATGTYRPTNTSDRSATFQMKSGVALYGNYAGYGAADPNLRGAGQFPSVLSGDIGTPGSNIDNSYHVVTATGVDASAILDGFTVTAGNATGDAVAPTGGGLESATGSPTVVNCIFTANLALVGGGIWVMGPAVIANCIIVGNTATRDGGGMEVGSLSLAVTNCIFVSNTAKGIGGGISNAKVNLTNCIFWGNTARIAAQVDLQPGAIVTYCDIQGGFAGAGNFSADPLFVRSPSPGADGTWGTSDDDLGDLCLQACSPLVDAGKNAAVPASITTDIGGSSRFVDIQTTLDTGLGTAPIVDIGAYETAPAFAASAGGPYVVVAGADLTLSGFGASNQAGALQYAWEWSGDGLFDEATGPNPIFHSSGLAPGRSLAVSVRMTDAASQSITKSTILRVVSPTIYVDAAATGTNTGADWNNAFTSLATALDTAVAGQQIHLAGGTYKPTTDGDIYKSFNLKSGVAIYGGYAGCTSSNPDARDIVSYPSILSGDISNGGTLKSYRVVVADGVDSITLVDGVTIAGGAGLIDGYSGAGISAYKATLTLVRCSISGNDGFGSYSMYSSPTLVDCDIVGNSGSGMSIEFSSPTLTNCRIQGNGSAATEGGGVSNSSSTLVMTNCSIIDNTAAAYGGGLSNESSTLTLNNCTITGNTAGGSGGGLYNVSVSSATLNNCVFTANSVGSTYPYGVGGGGVDNEYASALTLADCTFVGNVASTRSGGGLNNLAWASVTNCTFVGNSAGPSGGGVCDGQSVTMTNCILWANTATSGSQIQVSSGTPSLTYSDIQGGYTGAGNIDAAPQFVRNPSAGSDGTWGTADDDYGDLRIRTTSPCVDIGSNAAVPTGIIVDLGGNPRFADCPSRNDPGAIVDMGAFEVLSPTLSGSAADDALYLALSPDQTALQMWSSLTPAGSPAASYSLITLGGLSITPGAGSDTLTLDLCNGAPAIAIAFAGGDGQDTLVVAGTSSATSLNVQSTQILIGPTTLSMSGLECTRLGAPTGSAIALGSLTLAGPLVLSAGSSLPFAVGSLNITGEGSLDLADHALIVSYPGASPLEQIRHWLQNGQIGIAQGIFSSTQSASNRLAPLANAMVHLSSWHGQSLSGFSQVLIASTPAGDTNFDGQVTEADMLNILAGMNSPGTWLTGDINNDGQVTLDDLAEFTAHLPASFGPALVTPVIPAAKPKAAAVSAAKSAKTVKHRSLAPAAHPSKVAKRLSASRGRHR